VSDVSAIEWTDATWNPVTGCSKVSPGCAHCYIERQTPMRVAGRKFVRGAIPIQLHPERLDWPLRKRAPLRIFVNSMSDLFHEDVPDEFIAEVFYVMEEADQHTFQVLTKRPERMQVFTQWFYKQRHEARAGWVVNDGATPLPNVWLGVSVENQRWADERIPLLLRTPAARRFISAEPLLGPVDLSRWFGCKDPSCDCKPWLDWVIVGGESGPKHRPMDLAWPRSLRDQCAAAGVAYFFKQRGGTRAGDKLADVPDDLRIREFPERAQ